MKGYWSHKRSTPRTIHEIITETAEKQDAIALKLKRALHQTIIHNSFRERRQILLERIEVNKFISINAEIIGKAMVFR